MKSLKDYSLNIPEQEYHEYPAWSYSTIARYARNGFDAMSTLHDKLKPSPEMEFGSLFDSIITRGKDTLKEYAISNVTIPPAEKAVFDAILATDGRKYSYKELYSHHGKYITDAIDACETFCSKYKKPETRFAKLDECKEYYEVHRSGKKIVSEEDWHDAVQMANAFKSNEYLKNLFGKPGEKDGVEYIYQPQFVIDCDIESEQVKVKCMHDLIIVDHNNKTIQPVDLKTSGMPAYDFPEHFVKMRYDIQASLYTDVLSYVCQFVAPEYSDYTILPYLFTDISRTDMVPVTYTYDPSNGFAFSKGDKVYQYKGWKELLAEILVYEANEAKVPNGIVTDGPNDLIEILSK